MSSTAKRLAALEACFQAQRERVRDMTPAERALMREVHSLLDALPADLRADVEQRGPRGVGELVECHWERGAPGDDLPGAAVAAYRLAFGGRA